MVLVLLVLGTQRDGLIDLLFSIVLVASRFLVLFRSLLVHLFRQVLQALRLTVLVHDLTTEHVDLPLIFLVLRLSLIQCQLLIENSMLLASQSNDVQLIIMRSCQFVPIM